MKIVNIKNTLLRSFLCVRKRNNYEKQKLKWSTFKKKQVHNINKKIQFITRSVMKNYDTILGKKNIEILIYLIISLVTAFNMKSNINIEQLSYKKNVCATQAIQHVPFIANSTKITKDKRIDTVCVDSKNYQKQIIKAYQAYILTICLLKQTIYAKSSTTPVMLKSTLYTVLRSPHADKKSREQFASRVYNSTHLVEHHSFIMRAIEPTVRRIMHEYISSYKYSYSKFF